MSDGVKLDLARLRRLLVENTGEGKKYSRRSLSLLATDGRNPDLIRDFMRSNSKKPSVESVAGICKVLDVPISSVIVGSVPTADKEPTWLTVRGPVAAGVWRESAEWAPDEWFQIEVDHEEEIGNQTGLVVEGRSMDRIFPPGTILKCAPLIGSDLQLEPDDYVIVERKQGSLREITCKRLSRRQDGNWELVAESTLPEFRDPIFIGKPIESADGPGFDGITDDETRVTAVVMDAYLPLRRRRKRLVPNE